MTPWQYVELYGLLLVLIAVHEAGHHLAGALMGYRWKGWIVGPISISRETSGGQVHFGLSKTLFSGRALVFLHESDTLKRRAIFILGGPLATLLLGAGLLIYYLYLPGEQQNKAVILLATIALSGLFVLSSAIPHSRNGFKSDATRLIDLWRDKDRVARDTALMALVKALQNGQRPRDWDESLVKRMTALRDGKTNEALAAHYGFYWAADQCDWEESEQYIHRALALRTTLSDVFRAMVALDGAYCAALFQRDAAEARRLLTEASAVEAEDGESRAALVSMILRAEAAVLLAEGRPEEAIQKAQDALASLALVKANDCADRFLIERLLVSCAVPSGGGRDSSPHAGLSETPRYE